MTTTEFSSRQVRAAWAVHTLTASGVIIGMLGLHSVVEGHARAAILWLVAALLLDGIDGPIARKLDVKNRIPTLNGNTLDLVIDYLTCAVLPVTFMDRFDLLPANTIAPVGFAILMASALWMARTDQETPDGWFRGFPGEWNMVIPSMFLVGASRWVNLVICLVLCVLTLSRVQFPHPVSVRERRPIALTFLVLWLGSMTWLAIAQHRIEALRMVLVLAPAWTVWQVIDRHLHPGDPEDSPADAATSAA